MFVLLTLLWTVPMGFLFRYLILRSYEPLLRLDPKTDGKG